MRSQRGRPHGIGRPSSSPLHLVLSLVASRRVRHFTLLIWRAAAWLLVGKILRGAFARPVRTLLLTWLGLELWFRRLWLRKYHQLSSPAEQEPLDHDGPLAFQRLLAFLELVVGRPTFAVKMRSYISTWFLGAPWESMRRDNLADHLAMSFWYKPREVVHAAGHGSRLEAMVTELQERCQLHDLPEGHNPLLKGMWHLQEPLRASFRPLAFYAIMEGLAFATRGAMAALGFTRNVTPEGCVYYHQGFNGKPPLTLPSTVTLTGSVGDLPSACAPPTTLAITSATESVVAGLPLNSTLPLPLAAAHSVGALQAAGEVTAPGVPSKENAGGSAASGAEPPPSNAGGSAAAGIEPEPLADPVVAEPNATGAAAFQEEAETLDAAAIQERTTTRKVKRADALKAEAMEAAVWQVMQEQGYADALAAAGQPASVSPPWRPHRLDSEGLVPTVFMHGVGLGLTMYLPVIWRLVKGTAARKIPLVVMEWRHVSLRLCGEVPTADGAADAVVAALDQLGVDKAVVVGHSYGTFVASRLMQNTPERVHALALIDPVCFGMFIPQLLHNFCYAPARRDTVWHWVKDSFVRFASQELHIAATFCRRFFWTKIQLEPDCLPAHSLVIVGGRDELLGGEEVALALASVACARMGPTEAQPQDLITEHQGSITEHQQQQLQVADDDRLQGQMTGGFQDLTQQNSQDRLQQGQMTQEQAMAAVARARMSPVMCHEPTSPTSRGTVYSPVFSRFGSPTRQGVAGAVPASHVGKGLAGLLDVSQGPAEGAAAAYSDPQGPWGRSTGNVAWAYGALAPTASPTFRASSLPPDDQEGDSAGHTRAHSNAGANLNSSLNDAQLLPAGQAGGVVEPSGAGRSLWDMLWPAAGPGQARSKLESFVGSHSVPGGSGELQSCSSQPLSTHGQGQTLSEANTHQASPEPPSCSSQLSSPVPEPLRDASWAGVAGEGPVDVSACALPAWQPAPWEIPLHRGGDWEGPGEHPYETLCEVAKRTSGQLIIGTDTQLVLLPHMAHADFMLNPKLMVKVVDRVLDFVGQAATQGR